MGPLVEGVDHVYVPMADAKAGFGVLTEQLELPILWPFTRFGLFSSGGVSVGNIKLEIIEANASAPWCTGPVVHRGSSVGHRASSVDGEIAVMR